MAVWNSRPSSQRGCFLNFRFLFFFPQTSFSRSHSPTPPPHSMRVSSFFNVFHVHGTRTTFSKRIYLSRGKFLKKYFRLFSLIFKLFRPHFFSCNVDRKPYSCAFCKVKGSLQFQWSPSSSPNYHHTHPLRGHKSWKCSFPPLFSIRTLEKKIPNYSMTIKQKSVKITVLDSPYPPHSPIHAFL